MCCMGALCVWVWVVCMGVGYVLHGCIVCERIVCIGCWFVCMGVGE